MPEAQLIKTYGLGHYRLLRNPAVIRGAKAKSPVLELNRRPSDTCSSTFVIRGSVTRPAIETAAPP